MRPRAPTVASSGAKLRPVPLPTSSTVSPACSVQLRDGLRAHRLEGQQFQVVVAGALRGTAAARGRVGPAGPAPAREAMAAPPLSA